MTTHTEVINNHTRRNQSIQYSVIQSIEYAILQYYLIYKLYAHRQSNKENATTLTYTYLSMVLNLR